MNEIEFGSQGRLFGDRRAHGIVRGRVAVRDLCREVADDLVRTSHYSGSVVWSSHTHYGVYVDRALCGVLQFGPAMNPASGDRIIPGLPWCELNRLWLADDRPIQQLATGALSLACRLLRAQRPIEWMQTFADERSGYGAAYQAASFLYVGSHRSTFYRLGDEWFHKSLMYRAETDSRGWNAGRKAARLRGHESEAVPHTFTQRRYIKCFTRRARRRLLLLPLPYEKIGGSEPRVLDFSGDAA